MKDLSPEVPFKKLCNTKAWKSISLYVRLVSKGRCYTCGKEYPFKKLNAGHFIEKIGNPAIYFNLKGIRAQCFFCNRRRHGAKEIFARNLVREYGAGILEELSKAARPTKIWRKKELELIAKSMEELIRQFKVDYNKDLEELLK